MGIILDPSLHLNVSPAYSAASVRTTRFENIQHITMNRMNSGADAMMNDLAHIPALLTPRGNVAAKAACETLNTKQTNKACWALAAAPSSLRTIVAAAGCGQ